MRARSIWALVGLDRNIKVVLVFTGASAQLRGRGLIEQIQDLLLLLLLSFFLSFFLLEHSYKIAHNSGFPQLIEVK